MTSKPTTRELLKLKKEMRKAGEAADEGTGTEAQYEKAWKRYSAAEREAGFVKGLAAYLSD